MLTLFFISSNKKHLSDIFFGKQSLVSAALIILFSLIYTCSHLIYDTNNITKTSGTLNTKYNTII